MISTTLQGRPSNLCGFEWVCLGIFFPFLSFLFACFLVLVWEILLTEKEMEREIKLGS